MSFSGMGEFWAPTEKRRYGPYDLLNHIRQMISHGKWGQCREKTSTLAKLFLVTERTIRRWLKIIAPMVEVVRRGWHRCNAYRIRPQVVLPRPAQNVRPNVRSDRPGPYVSNSGIRILKIVQRVVEQLPFQEPAVRRQARPKAKRESFWDLSKRVLRDLGYEI